MATIDKFHENIRRERANKGYSQDDIAEKMGIERSTYSNFELGKTKLFAKNMYRFAEIVGKSEEEILLGNTPLTAGYLQEGILEDRINVLDAKIDLVSEKLDTILSLLSGRPIKKRD